MIVQRVVTDECRETKASPSRILTLLVEVWKETENSLSCQDSRPECVYSKEQFSEVRRLVGVLLELVRSLIGTQDWPQPSQVKEDLGIPEDLPHLLSDGSPIPDNDDDQSSFEVGNGDVAKDLPHLLTDGSPIPDDDNDDDQSSFEVGNDDVGKDDALDPQLSASANIPTATTGAGGRTRLVQNKRPKAWVCRYCEKTCRTEFALRSHLKRHRDQPSPTAVHDESAVEVIDSEEKEESNKWGDEETCRISILNNDRLSSSSKKQFQCPHCEKILKSRGCLDSHIKGIHGEKKFQCGQCGLKYGLQTQLNVHVARDHEGRNFPCEYEGCVKVYKTKNAMKSHVSSFHEGVKHLCALCGKSFSREESLLSHRLYVHEEKGSVCKICGKGFKRPESMHKHVARVHRGKTFPCQLCGKELSTPKSRRDHVANMHREEESAGGRNESGESERTPSFTCDQCGKVKRTVRGLKLHMASVHEGRKFPCKICGEEFNWHSLRRNHIRTVHEGVKFDCQFCGKNFSQGSALKTHVDSVHRKPASGVHVGIKSAAALIIQDKLIQFEQLTNAL